MDPSSLHKAFVKPTMFSMLGGLGMSRFNLSACFFTDDRCDHICHWFTVSCRIAWRLELRHLILNNEVNIKENEILSMIGNLTYHATQPQRIHSSLYKDNLQTSLV